MLLILIILLVLALATYSIYASIIRKKNVVEESFSGIDVQLTKRHELIPNLIATAQKFMEHEKGLLEEITQLRSNAIQASQGKDLEKTLATENALGSKLGQLMVSVENYPNLKSDATMLEVQKGLQDVEEHLAASRRFYNSAVRQLNDSIHIWPMSMIAAWISIKAYPYFEATQAAKTAPDAEKLFS